MKLPEKIAKFIDKASLEEIGIGCSNSQVFKIKRADGTYFLKMAATGLLTKEYQKLVWLEKRLAVPEVVIYWQEWGNEYLITKEVEGIMLCAKYFKQHKEEAVEIIKEVFTELQKIDIRNCPFDVSIKARLTQARSNVQNGLIKTSDLSEEVRKRFGSVDNLLKYLEDNQYEEELVFSFGDLSLPNIIVGNQQLSGLIDVGECGIADKWLDIAIVEKSLRRNLQEDAVKLFYQMMDIQRDAKKIEYQLLLLELLV